MSNIVKEVKDINEGKKFETQFKASVNEQIYFQRIRDPAQSFTQTDALRFSLQNPYDCFMYLYPNLFTLELKSTGSTSMSFYRDDFIEDGKKQTFMIKKNQIKGLLESSKFIGVVSGFVLNFRTTKHTYFWDINDFKTATENLDKKSFNESDVINNNGYLINQELKRTNYKYDVQKFVADMQLKVNYPRP